MILFDDVAYLIGQAYVTNAIGDAVPTETRRMVYVAMKSIGLKRKIDAMATGLNIEFKLILSDLVEYNDEKIIEYKGVRYNIKHTFVRDDRSVELFVGVY